MREEQARRTRSLIRGAARELFDERGFTSTPIGLIAEKAGVSSATVYAIYESKAGIVAAMVDELEQSVDMGRRLGELFAERDPRRQMQLWLGAHCALFEGGVVILRAAIGAAGTPEVAALMERGNSRRREVIQSLVGGWRALGALRHGLSADDATDTMFLMTTVEGYVAAVDDLGWAPIKYEAWLVEMLAGRVFIDAS